MAHNMWIWMVAHCIVWAAANDSAGGVGEGPYSTVQYSTYMYIESTIVLYRRVTESNLQYVTLIGRGTVFR